MTFIREINNLFTYNYRFTERLAFHDCRNVFQKALQDLKIQGFKNLHGKNVLDLGCGQRFPFALQCAAEGAKVTSLDIDYVKPESLVKYFARGLKHSGFKRAIKSTIRRLCFDKSYYRSLEECTGKPVCDYASEIEFVTGNAKNSHYSLPSEEYDLIASNAVLEHVSDVSGFTCEIKRLLRPGGYFYGNMHNFYSISGDHNMEWAFPDEIPSKTVPPWDHLRANKYPTHVFLNQYKPEQFKKEFAEYLEILLFEAKDINHDSGGKEGEQFLRGQVAEELDEYPRDLLLTRAYCIICRKSS
jgi:SAM-dependent methyltransferase